MKTVNIKLTMVVVLLLTGGNLLAQYDPQTGRFHQRDPFAINPGPAPGGVRPQISPQAQAMTDLAQINAFNAANRLRQTALVPHNQLNATSQTSAVHQQIAVNNAAIIAASTSTPYPPDPSTTINTSSGIDPTRQYQDGMNTYQYTASNPANYVDPYGLIKKFICCTPWQIATLKQNEITAQSQITALKAQINSAILADVGQYPWFTNPKLKNAIKILNSASPKIASCTAKCSKKKTTASASAWPWGNTVTIYTRHWVQSGTIQGANLVHEGTHMGSATTDAAYFWQKRKSPRDVLIIGWDIIASTYDTWIIRGFCIPGYNCP